MEDVEEDEDQYQHDDEDEDDIAIDELNEWQSKLAFDNVFILYKIMSSWWFNFFNSYVSLCYSVCKFEYLSK